MPPSASPVSILTTEQAWSLLERNSFGRLSTSVNGQPDIFPINYVVWGDRLLFRTAEGSKLAEAVANPRIAFEIDGYTTDSAWSVVVKGYAHVVDDSEYDAADQAGLTPWVPTIKNNFVAITPDDVTGRSFALGEEPSREL